MKSKAVKKARSGFRREFDFNPLTQDREYLPDRLTEFLLIPAFVPSGNYYSGIIIIFISVLLQQVVSFPLNFG